MKQCQWKQYLDHGQAPVIPQVVAYDPQDTTVHVYEEVFYQGVLVARLSRQNTRYKIEVFVPDQERVF